MIETRNACLDRNFIRITRAMTTDIVAMTAMMTPYSAAKLFRASRY